jgi:hypothetical protein
LTSDHGDAEPDHPRNTTDRSTYPESFHVFVFTRVVNRIARSFQTAVFTIESAVVILVVTAVHLDWW